MKLNKTEKRTLLYLLIAAFFNGFVMSSMQIQEIVAKKALHAVDWQITILVMLWPISNLFSIWWGKILEHSKSLSRYFILTAFVGRLSLILMLFVYNYYQYLGILIVLFSFNALISPAQNSIYQFNLRPQIRGKYFGLLASVVTFVVIIFSYVSGKLLDINEEWFRYIFVFVGIAGCVSSLWMAMIKINKKNVSKRDSINAKQLFLTPVLRSLEVLKKNRDFALFQRNFFLYGIAFMVLMPAIPKYLVEYLKMDYTQTFLAKGVISQIGILFLAPIAGKIFDKKNPVYFASITFAVLSLYPLTLLISCFFVGTSFVNVLVYFAFFIYGIGMSAVVIAWNISSIFFAGKEDVSMYQSVHVSLTGLRGVFAPFLGYFILSFLGVEAVFGFSFIFFVTASILSLKHFMKMDRKEFSFAKSKDQIISYFKKFLGFS